MIESSNLNQAAVFLTLGAKLLRVDSSQQDWKFIFKVNKWQVWYEKNVGWVPYRKYVGCRVTLKKRVYAQEGRDIKFRGQDQGFWFNDVVRIKRWDKK